MDAVQWLTVTTVLATYAGVAVGRVPGLRMNRATIALVGAALLVAFGVLTQEQAFHSLDLGTLLLLAAMMVINTNLRLAGFFGLVGSRVLRLAKTPRMLLGLVILASGVLSALFLNDPVCLLFTPLVVQITLRLRRNPVPYLVGLATAANVGSTATITGNPQNLIIGQASGIPYLTFLLSLGPVALIGLLICWVVIMLVYPREFTGRLELVGPLPEPTVYPPLLRRTTLVVIVLLFAFLGGLPIASSAAVAAGALLISRLRPHKLLDIDWELLAFFAGLFVVTGAIEVTGVSERIFSAIAPVLQGGVASLSIATGVLSNVVSNVPAVLLLRPEIPTLPNPGQAWLTLAMASTLAGNLTLLGSAANLIVAEVAAGQGVKLGFMAYLRAGIPITILTILVGIWWLGQI
jgi:Na+/H+ antiporter NhaD/arsenite permease-like protein